MESVDLKAWRTRLKKSQPDMAHMLGCSHSTYEKWEGLDRHPPAATRRLFEVLQMCEMVAPVVFNEFAKPRNKGKAGRPRKAVADTPVMGLTRPSGPVS